jgi:ABC-type multidrug transport system ATPase subunit
VLFLDEPTLGLDVLARRQLWREIEALKQNMTIVLTTHYMEEAQALADRIVILTEGNVKAIGTLEELAEQLKISRKTMVFYATPTYKKRVKKGINRRVLVRVE